MEFHVCESAQAACESAGLLMAAQITRVMTDIIHLHSPYAWDLPRDKCLLMQCKISEFFLKVNDCTIVSGVGNVGIVYIKRCRQEINSLTWKKYIKCMPVARLPWTRGRSSQCTGEWRISCSSPFPRGDPRQRPSVAEGWGEVL